MLKALQSMKKWEKGLSAGAAAALAISLALFAQEFSVRTIRDGGLNPKGLGTLGAAKSTRRQHRDDRKFRKAQVGDEVLDQETLSTTLEGAATVDFADGGKVELSGYTMARFLSSSGSGATIELVSGKLSARSNKHPIVVRADGKAFEIKPNTAKTIEYSTEKPPSPDNPVRVSEQQLP